MTQYGVEEPKRSLLSSLEDEQEQRDNLELLGVGDHKENRTTWTKLKARRDQHVELKTA